jgi:Na+-translocating ferredoxin:NAD+ oxidoreductase RnfG subunit
MLRSAISSRPGRTLAGARSRQRGRAFVVAQFLCALSAGGAGAQQVTTQEQALARAFPGADTIERRTAYLDEAQLADAGRRAGKGVDVRQSVVTYYVALENDRPVGVAYFDNHRVRTLPQVIMVLVTPDARIRRIEVLKFMEPPEYRAPPAWLAQFDGKPLAPSLALKRDIVNMTGATLTSDAVTKAARRVLALHAVIAPLGSEP